MKKNSFAITTTFFSLFIFSAFAQTSKTAIKKEKHDEYYLPGKPYGLGLVIPPLINDDFPKTPEIITITADLALSSNGSITIEKTCENYYHVTIPLKIYNDHARHNIGAYLVVRDETKVLSNTESGTNESLQSVRVFVEAGSETTFFVKLKLYYPYTLNYRNGMWEKDFLELLKTTSVEIKGANVPGGRVIFVEDSNNSNNKVRVSHTTPLPILCIDPSSSSQTN